MKAWTIEVKVEDETDLRIALSCLSWKSEEQVTMATCSLRQLTELSSVTMGIFRRGLRVQTPPRNDSFTVIRA